MRHEKYFWKKCHTLYLLVSVLSVSLSADMKNFILVFYRYRPIRKLSLSGFIGISRYEKRFSDSCTLTHMYFLCLSRSELTKSYITINTKNGKTKTIEKIVPIIQVEDPNETSVIEYLGEPDEAQCSKI